jgi:biotin carboxylase
VKKLILLSSASSYRLDAFQRAATHLGIPVVHGEDVPPPMLGKSTAELPLDYRDQPRSVRRIARYADEHPVGAVIGLDDSGTQIAAQASRQLGLPYNDPQAALAAANKHLMRQHFAAAGVPSPNFRYFTLKDDPEAIADEIAYPAVVKPIALAGSQGVMRVDGPPDFIRAHGRLAPILRANRCDELLVEDFIPGQEFALEGLLDDGQLYVLALFDKPDPLDGPFFEETIYVTPSRLAGGDQQAIADVAARAAAALGLENGPVHAELRLSPSGPVMVELAARSIGGHCSRTLHFASDMSLEELILRQAFHLPFETRREGAAGGVMMIPIPSAGILKAVRGLEAARAVPLVTEVEISAPLNQRLVPLPEGDSYLGFIFASGETPAAVETALRQAHRALDFEIAPELNLLAVRHQQPAAGL